jgi:ATP-dependent Clp protease ATP-binding subunit ClpB
MEVVRQAFRPEFINRLDETVLFHRLFREHMDGIVDIQLGHLRHLLAGRGLSIELDNAARARLADDGYDPVYGARPLKRVIQTCLQNRLAGLILESQLEEGDKILISANKEGLTINGELSVKA